MNKLTGVTFAYNAISQDYCLTESVASLKEFCDEVIVLDAGSTDGTSELIKSFQDRQTRVILCDNEEWRSQHGKWKLSYFTNKAIDQVNTEWIYYQQADEITHESSYEYIRVAVNNPVAEGYLISRINLWGSPYMMLNVPLERMPCSTEVIRLTKSCFRAFDDAESIGCMAVAGYLPYIRMYHMGFVRDKRRHVEKIRHMQAEVFQVGVDAKLAGMEVFDPFKWFSADDLSPIEEELPALIKNWAKERE
jgi:glycosyltransferase involved in cell wall biosynthesis